MTSLPPPEFSRIVRLSEIGNSIKTARITATTFECSALAKRFGLPSIESFSAEYKLTSSAKGIIFDGTIDANLHQSCAISAEPFPVKLREDFNIAFVEQIAEPDYDQEIELEANDCDMIEISGNQIDLGEAAAQSLYLALPPYPRGPEADAVAEKAGLKSEAQAGPFGVLAALKEKLT